MKLTGDMPVSMLMHDDELNDENELTHWGIPGMKWGVRRYQNKDGSLTPAGKRKLAKESEKIKQEEAVLKNRKATQAKFDRLAAKRKALEDKKKELDGEQKSKKSKKEDKDAKPPKKDIKDMTDDELASAVRRAQLEQQYNSLQPDTTKKGNSFAKDFWDKSAVPAIQEAGKNLLKDSLMKLGKKYLGLDEQKAESYIDKLKKEHEKLSLEDKIQNLKNKAAKAAEKEKAKAAEKEKKAADKAAEKEKSADEKVEKAQEKVFEGEVEGVGSSSRTSSQGKKWTNNTIVDADRYEIVTTSNTSSGRSYVSNYLETSGSRPLALPAPRTPALPAPRDDD